MLKSFLHSFLLSEKSSGYGTIFICVLVTLLEYLLTLNSLPSDFSRPFFRRFAREEKTFSSLCC